MGAIALKEKCLNIASCAKIIPPIGELNPAEIAAATPQPIKVSLESQPGVNLFIKLPMVPPK